MLLEDVKLNRLQNGSQLELRAFPSVLGLDGQGGLVIPLTESPTQKVTLRDPWCQQLATLLCRSNNGQ